MNVKRWFCLLLTLLMLLSMLPAAVIAEDVAEDTGTQSAGNLFQMTQEQFDEVKKEYQAKGDLLWLNSIDEADEGGKALPDWGYRLYYWLEQELELALKGEDSVLVDPYAHNASISYPTNEAYKTTPVVQWFDISGGDMDKTEVCFYAEAVFTAFLQDRPDAFWFNKSTYCVTTEKIDYLGFVIYNVNKMNVATAPNNEKVAIPTKNVYIHSKKYAKENEKGDVIVFVQNIENRITVLNNNLKQIITGFTSKEEETTIKLDSRYHYNAVHYFYWLLITRNAYNPYANPGGGKVRELADLDAWKSISALVGGTGYSAPVCNGFAAAFKLLCDRVGVPCVTEAGIGNVNVETTGGDHIWNYVQLGNEGKWYCLDITWCSRLINQNKYLNTTFLKYPVYSFANDEADIRFANSVDGFTAYNSQVNIGTEYERWFLIGSENTTSEFIDGKITQVTPVDIAHVGHGLVARTKGKVVEEKFFWEGLDDISPVDYVDTTQDSPKVGITGFTVDTTEVTVNDVTLDEQSGKKVFERNVTFRISAREPVVSAGLLVFDHQPVFHNVHTAKQVIDFDLEQVVAGTENTLKISGIDAAYLKNDVEFCLYFKLEDYSYIYSGIENLNACRHSLQEDVCSICGNYSKYYLVVEKKNEDGSFGPAVECADDPFFVFQSENDAGFAVATMEYEAADDCRVSIRSADSSQNFRTVGTPQALDTMVPLYRQDIRKHENEGEPVIESSGLYLSADQSVTLTLTKQSDVYLMLGYECDGHEYKEKVIREATCQTEGEKLTYCAKCGQIDNLADKDIPKVTHEEGTACSVCTDATYTLFGCINNKNVSIGNKDHLVREYCFNEENGNKITILSGTESQIAVKTVDNETWYMADRQTFEEKNGTVTAILRPVTEVTQKRYTLPIPAMTAVEVTLQNGDEAGTLTLSYQKIDDLKKETVPETAFSDGSDTYTMNTDPSRMVQIIKPARKHNTAKAPLNAYTCVSVQYLRQTCSEDGCTNEGHYKDIKVQPLGHIVKPSKEGERVKYTCMQCGDVWEDMCVATDQKDLSEHDLQEKIYDPECTISGCNLKSCICGVYESEYIAAKGHSYIDGKCATCEENKKTVTEPTIALQYPSVEFNDIIRIRIYTQLTKHIEMIDMGLLTWNENPDECDITTAKNQIPGYTVDAATGYYVITTQGIPAKEMGDTIYMAAYVKLSDGTYRYSSVVSYCPRDYAYNTLERGAKAMKPLAVAMLNYGAAAQNYFSYDTDNLMNKDLKDEHKALVLPYAENMIEVIAPISETKLGCFVKKDGFGRVYPSVSFEGAFSINFYANAEKTPADGVTMYYWSAKDFNKVEVLTKENATGKIDMTSSGNEYRATIENIVAKYLDEPTYVAFSYSDGTTDYVTKIYAYSIGLYCKTQAGSPQWQQSELAKATAVYGFYAKELFLNK